MATKTKSPNIWRNEWIWSWEIQKQNILAVHTESILGTDPQTNHELSTITHIAEVYPGLSASNMYSTAG